MTPSCHQGKTFFTWMMEHFLYSGIHGMKLPSNDRLFFSNFWLHHRQNGKENRSEQGHTHVSMPANHRSPGADGITTIMKQLLNTIAMRIILDDELVLCDTALV